MSLLAISSQPLSAFCNRIRIPARTISSLKPAVTIAIGSPISDNNLRQRYSIKASATSSSEFDDSPSSSIPFELHKSSRLLNNLSFCAFWGQLALTLVSAGVLIFSVAIGGISRTGIDISKYFCLGAVLLSFVSTFFANGFLKLSRTLATGGGIDSAHLAANLLRSTTVNLFGIGLATFGLQASVGTLVGKSLLVAATSPFQQYNSGATALVSLDVFALQASTNVLLCHLLGMSCANIMLRVVNAAKSKTSSV